MSTAHAPTTRCHHPLVTMSLARLREFIREPQVVFWSYAVPLILVLTLGFAFRDRPIKTLRIAVVGGAGAEPALARLKGDPQFRAEMVDEQEARRRLESSRADLMLRASAGTANRYDYSFDPNRTESLLARNMADDFLQRAAGRSDVAEVRDHQLGAVAGRYADFLVPGLLGMSLMSGGTMGVGYAIVEMRVRKLLKHYFATPVRHSHFLAAILISRLLITVTQAIMLLLFARWFFGVTSAGGYLAVALVIFFGSLQFSGLGLLLGSRAAALETFSGLMQLTMLPMWLGSGIFFSTERFPTAVQSAVGLLPLTPLIHALRAIMLEGAGLVSLCGDLGLMAIWGCGAFMLALYWFRWK
jgi:ABC-type multidrug transport system permease subunit